MNKNHDIMNFEYEYKEVDWDNIPQIIPMYMINISKQFVVMQRWQDEKDRQLSATEVHDKLTAIIEEMSSRVTILREWSVEYSNQVTERLDGFYEVDRDLDERVTVFQTKLEREEYYDINDYINEPGKKDADSDSEDNEYLFPPEASKKWDNLKNEPRFWTFEQFKTAFFRLLKTSKFKRNIKHLKASLKDNKCNIESLIQRISDNYDDLNNKDAQSKKIMDQFSSQFKEYAEYSKRQSDNVYDKFDQFTLKLKQIEKRVDEIDVTQKDLLKKVEKITQRVTFQEQLIKDKTESIRTDINESLNKSQAKFDKQYKTLVKEMDSYKSEFLQKTDNNREFTWQELSKHTLNIEKLLDDFKSEHANVHNRDMTKVNDRISDVQTQVTKVEDDSVSCDELLEKRLLNIESKFKETDYSSLKPSRELELKLDHFVTTLNELEISSKNSNIVIRDVIKKLIFAMETSLISGKTIGQIGNANRDSVKLLHNDSALTVNKSNKPRFETPDRSRSEFEHLFLKRLEFLKKLISDDTVNVSQQKISGMYAQGSNMKLSSVWDNRPLNQSPKWASKDNYNWDKTELSLSMDTNVLLRDKSYRRHENQVDRSKNRISKSYFEEKNYENIDPSNLPKIK